MLSLTRADLPPQSIDGKNMTSVDSVTFEAFCRSTHPSIVNALRWTLGDADLAEDAANEAFARAYERWDRLGGGEPGANIAGWVYTTGLHWARRRISRRKRERELTLSAPEAMPEIGVDHLDLQRALMAVPLAFRSVLVLRLLLQHTEAETAAVLGVEVGTVKSRMSRGLEKLRIELAGEGFDGRAV
jgi:RNA polymerase sigma factor (sigma-70 family)